MLLSEIFTFVIYLFLCNTQIGYLFPLACIGLYANEYLGRILDFLFHFFSKVMTGVGSRVILQPRSLVVWRTLKINGYGSCYTTQ